MHPGLTARSLKRARGRERANEGQIYRLYFEVYILGICFNARPRLRTRGGSDLTYDASVSHFPLTVVLRRVRSRNERVIGVFVYSPAPLPAEAELA